MPRSSRACTEEIRLRRAQLTPVQRHDPVFGEDSSNWDVWFAMEHDVHRRSTAYALPPPLLVPEKEETEAAYQAALEETLQRALEESQCE